MTQHKNAKPKKVSRPHTVSSAVSETTLTETDLLRPASGEARADMIDVMGVKLKVIQFARGIKALSAVELLHRLEKLYLEGVKDGATLLNERVLEDLRREEDSKGEKDG